MKLGFVTRSEKSSILSFPVQQEAFQPGQARFIVLIFRTLACGPSCNKSPRGTELRPTAAAG